MIHIPPQPACWTAIATARPWKAVDLAQKARADHEAAYPLPGREAFIPSYLDDARMCRAYSLLTTDVQAACNGCARIGDGE